MLHSYVRTTLIVLACFVCLAQISLGQDESEAPAPSNPTTDVVTFKPTYAPPSEILDFLGVTGTGAWNIVEWQEADGWHSVEVRVNAPANLLVVSGHGDDIDHVMELIKQADTPPRQIEIEVKIVEIFKSKAQDLGLDWETLLDRTLVDVHYTHNYRTEGTNTDVRAYGSVSNLVKILDESGAGTIRTAPRVLTLNNKPASILDGERVTYITQYSSYTNLFETDSMDAGLVLTVTPSLGESGYITMDIVAELTTLRSIMGYGATTPSKQGQMIENTVVVKDGESVLLGGRTRVLEEKRKKRFPLLGHVLPFLFSREITIYDEVESFVVITPRVVDFDSAINMETRAIIEGQ